MHLIMVMKLLLTEWMHETKLLGATRKITWSIEHLISLTLCERSRSNKTWLSNLLAMINLIRHLDVIIPHGHTIYAADYLQTAQYLPMDTLRYCLPISNMRRSCFPETRQTQFKVFLTLNLTLQCHNSLLHWAEW